MKRTQVILSGVVIFVLLLVALATLWFRHSIEVKTNPGAYPRVVATRVGYDPRCGFLPRTIPANASRVAFWHLPGLLQGGDIIALRLGVSGPAIQQTAASLEVSGRAELRGFDSMATPLAYPAFGFRRRWGHDPFEGVSELPADFRVFLWQCDVASIKSNWNHHFLAFTAVSTQRQEIVYYAVQY